MPSKDLKNQVYDILLNRIVKMEYPPGAMINMLSLHEELNVSRTPIQNAMLLLERERLVEILPKRGVRVTQVTPEMITEIYESRKLIETYAVSDFGKNIDKENCLRYAEFFSKSHGVEEYDEVFDVDTQLHMEIVHLTNNSFLCDYYASLRNQFVRLCNLTGRRSDERIRTSNQEHVKILMALLRGDTEGAKKAVEEHLENAAETAFRVIMQENQSMQTP